MSKNTIEVTVVNGVEEFKVLTDGLCYTVCDTREEAEQEVATLNSEDEQSAFANERIEELIEEMQEKFRISNQAARQVLRDEI